MRVLITGSRDWDKKDTIRNALESLYWIHGKNVVLVSGACPTGADKFAEEIAANLGWTIERHPADWAAYGKFAGPKRNQEMVNMGADVCLAFIKNGSKGATHASNRAAAADIPTWVYSE